MARPKAEEHIPKDVLAAARSAGLKSPMWYVGRSAAGKEVVLERTLDDVVAEACADEESRALQSGDLAERPEGKE